MSVILYVANSVSGPPSFAAVNSTFSTSFGRTDLRLSPSRAKLAEESDFDVRLAVAPKPHQMKEKLVFGSKHFADFFVLRGKVKSYKSLETRFGKFWRRSERCSRGKLTFEVGSRQDHFPQDRLPGMLQGSRGAWPPEHLAFLALAAFM